MMCTNSECGHDVKILSSDSVKTTVSCPRCGVYGVLKK